MSDVDAGQPMLTEMAEKLRQARGVALHDQPETPHRADDRPRHEAPAQTRRDDRNADAGPDPLQVSLRIDSFERRLFDLRTALDEMVRQVADDGAGARAAAPSDAEAWIAFAAAAVGRWDDADDQAEAADRLLAEYRERRRHGGVLGGD